MDHRIQLRCGLIKVNLIILCLSLLVSCYREPFDIDATQFGPSIVIEGNVTDQEGPHTVKISRTTELTGENVFPRVSGATVSIHDNLNNTVELKEVTSGIYQTSALTGVPGRTYTLIVKIKNEIYTAACVMPQPISLQDFQFETIDTVNNLNVITCSFKDRPKVADYCLLNVYYNRHLIDYYLYKDDMTDGEKVVLDDFGIFYGQDDQAAIELLTLDKTIYEFFYTLDVIANAEDNEFVSTFLPVTTLNPTTNFDNGALGYFSAHTIRRYEKTVP
jgi:hypothetical protein